MEIHAMGIMEKLSAERLAEMAAVDVRSVELSSLTDLRDIKIDTKAPVFWCGVNGNGSILERI